LSKIKVLSFAKINLSIDVGPVDESGFHPVDMIMQQLSFHDDVDITYTEHRGSTGEKPEIRLHTNRYYLPTDRRNLAYKAAELMIETYGDRAGTLDINIHKRIPVAAGLAGGSGNGAAVIHGLNVLWNLRLGLSDICGLCAKLGSDVPFSAIGQAKANYRLPRDIRKDPMASSCARATGRGTILQPIRGIVRPVVLAKPPLGVSTAEVYRGIDACRINRRPDNDKLAEDLDSGNPTIYDNFINVLEEYTLDSYPEVAELKRLMEETGAEKVLMSGSGPTVFAVYDSMETAISACGKLRDSKYEAYWTKTTK